ncbi:extensin family protein [Devosia limi]|nr:extensin family protein [Devosia limi]
MFTALPFAILASCATPALGQDILAPFERMIEALSPQEPQRPAVDRVQETPPKPLPRPDAAEDAEAVPTAEATPLPRPRPEAADVVEPAAEAEPAVEAEPAAEARVYQTACPAVLMGLVEAEALPPLAEGICGERSPIRVTGVLSRGRMVATSTPIITNCDMASALPAWVEAVDLYALATADAGIDSITIGTSHMCRNRNNASSGFTSEHGFANAIDVVGFTLANGETIALEADWLPAAAPKGRLLRFAHDAACTGFTTVLGPEANADHEDHLHLDLGCHGQSCTARICE